MGYFKESGLQSKIIIHTSLYAGKTYLLHYWLFSYHMWGGTNTSFTTLDEQFDYIGSGYGTYSRGFSSVPLGHFALQEYDNTCTIECTSYPRWILMYGRETTELLQKFRLQVKLSCNNSAITQNQTAEPINLVLVYIKYNWLILVLDRAEESGQAMYFKTKYFDSF